MVNHTCGNQRYLRSKLQVPKLQDQRHPPQKSRCDGSVWSRITCVEANLWYDARLVQAFAKTQSHDPARHPWNSLADFIEALEGSQVRKEMQVLVDWERRVEVGDSFQCQLWQSRSLLCMLRLDKLTASTRRLIPCHQFAGKPNCEFFDMQSISRLHATVRWMDGIVSAFW